MQHAIYINLFCCRRNAGPGRKGALEAHLRSSEIMALWDGDGAGDELRDRRPGLWDALRIASRVRNGNMTLVLLICLFGIIGLQMVTTDICYSYYSHTSNRLEDSSLHFI